MNMEFILSITIVVLVCIILSITFKRQEDKVEWDDDLDSEDDLISELISLRLITGLSRSEREILDKAVAYIEHTKGKTDE